MTDIKVAAVEDDKREAVLKAAITVFADRGFDAATLREITQAAGANIAAVNYYFRSKDDLIRSALEACLRPLNQARLRALAACDFADPSNEQTLELIVDALVRPMVELGADDAGRRTPVRLLLQARALPRPLTNAILADEFDHVHSRFQDMLKLALPHLSSSEIALRYDFARGAVLQIVADLDPAVRHLPELEFSEVSRNNEIVIRNLTRFIAAGFRAGSLDEA